MTDGLVPFRAIQPGQTVWQEERGYPLALRMTVIECKDAHKNRAECHYTAHFGGKETFVCDVREDDRHRYWDQEPTKEERECAEWPQR